MVENTTTGGEIRSESGLSKGARSKDIAPTEQLKIARLFRRILRSKIIICHKIPVPLLQKSGITGATSSPEVDGGCDEKSSQANMVGNKIELSKHSVRLTKTESEVEMRESRKNLGKIKMQFLLYERRSRIN